MKRIVLIASMVLSNVMFGSYEKFSAALVKWSAAESANEKAKALNEVQEIYREANEYDRLRVLADLEQEGLSAQMLGLTMQEPAAQPKPQPRPQPKPKPTAAAPQMPQEKYPLAVKYVTDKAVLKSMTDEQKQLLEGMIPGFKEDGDEGYVKFMVNEQLKQFALAAPQMQKEKYPLVAKYVADQGMLKGLTDGQKQKLEALITELQNEGDEGYVKLNVRMQLSQFTSQPKPKPATPARPTTDTKHRGERPAAGSAVAAAQLNVVFLPKHTEGGACTYNMISDAQQIVYALNKKGSVSANDLSNQCDVNLMKEARKSMSFEDSLAPDFNEHIIPLMKQINFMAGKNYAVITTDAVNNPARSKELAETLDAANTGDYPTVMAAITALKTLPQTIQVFLVGTGGHWFVVVADKRAGTITLYLSDRDMKQMGDNNKAAIQLIKNLLA